MPSKCNRVQGSAASAAGGVLTDTHAASLTGSDTHSVGIGSAGMVEAVGAMNTDYLNTVNCSAMLSATTLEKKFIETTGITGGAVSNIFTFAYYQIENRSTARTFIVRIRQGIVEGAGFIMVSETTASIAQNASVNGSLSADGGAPSGSQTCHLSVQEGAGSAATAVGEAGLYMVIANASLLGADTHAATLTGGASCSACVASGGATQP